MADPVSSKPWLATFVFLIPVLGMVVQMHFPNSSPADKHSTNVWISIVCLFIYGFSFAYYKSHASASNNDTSQLKLSSQIAAISGSMACIALISMLVASKAGLAIIIIIYFICLLIYFAPSPVIEICKTIICPTCAMELSITMTTQEIT